MRLGVMLNRVFRLKHNPLFDEVISYQSEIEKLYVIVPIEDMSDAAEIKKNHYYEVVQGFIDALKHHHIHPFIVPYEGLAEFVKKYDLTHILMPNDIMSYHLDIYDYPHVKLAFEKRDIQLIGCRVNHYFRPGNTLNQKGEPYKVFTSFYRANRPQLMRHDKPLDSYKQIVQYAEKGTNETKIQWQQSQDMERHAREAWMHFLAEDITHYKALTEDVSQSDVSRLGQYLAYGLLDIHEVINDLLDGYEADEVNYEAYLREIMFREFYYVLMTYYPNTATEAFSEKYRQMKWSHNEAHFEAWKKGQTGYPLVDAAMRKLNRTGYMHNRLRMVVSQFLTKHLFIDWTKGEAYFRQHLLDYDNASNVHGWQWSASTGTDAVPYFRMFNPIRQSERFDKNGYFIQSEVKELEGISSKYIHEPTKYQKDLKTQYQVIIGTDYPKAIVDHQAAREYVMTQFKQL
ncbi:deoxyribodipyrimidine photo-lyase [Staphylococcus felis]|uniref:cryptochrome/photolyase family protein n=1 Tax=Staphylococcus felis TaxID=46127 RepID=UPI000E25CB40|nr:deoxyribodipyrimidine photo-lyase [Staphylococcus felis]REI10321.1 deoxyribodipyrimidine photo-lyase [Staphylococcus felis]